MWRHMNKKQKKEAGLCVECGALSRAGKTRCGKCAEKAKIYAKRLKEQKKAAGVCIRCGKYPSLPDKTICNGCRIDGSKRATNRTKKRMASGCCIECDQAAIKNNLCQYHSECRLEQIAQAKIRRDKRREAGLCEECGDEGLQTSSRKTILCKICYLKALSRKHFSTSSRWKDLENLFQSKPICPYTGISLELGVNASLDHITPTSRGGSNLLENMQFVYTFGSLDVNLMKGANTDAEYREAIRVQYNHLFGEKQ